MWKDSLKDLLYKEAKHNATRIRSSSHAAAIVHRGSVLCIGHNQYKTHPLVFHFSKNPKKVCLHAELDAIVRCVRKHGPEVLKKSELYVLRVNKQGKIASSKPCVNCSRAIKAFGLKAYWTENGD